MQDLGVSRLKIDAIYHAAANFGQSAWDEDASLKNKRGETRSEKIPRQRKDDLGRLEKKSRRLY
jgi:hypothetical protein